MVRSLDHWRHSSFSGGPPLRRLIYLLVYGRGTVWWWRCFLSWLSQRIRYDGILCRWLKNYWRAPETCWRRNADAELLSPRSVMDCGSWWRPADDGGSQQEKHVFVQFASAHTSRKILVIWAKKWTFSQRTVPPFSSTQTYYCLYFSALIWCEIPPDYIYALAMAYRDQKIPQDISDSSFYQVYLEVWFRWMGKVDSTILAKIDSRCR